MLVLPLLMACDPPPQGFAALPALGIYQTSLDPVDDGCEGLQARVASEGEPIAIEAIRDGDYRELALLDNPVVTTSGEVPTTTTIIALSPIDDTLFYARDELGVPGCAEALEVREYFAAVGSSIELTVSTRWSDVADCTEATIEVPSRGCDATTIYDFELAEACDEPCSLERQDRLVRGTRRFVPTCSCPDSETGDTDG